VQKTRNFANVSTYLILISSLAIFDIFRVILTNNYFFLTNVSFMMI